MATASVSATSHSILCSLQPMKRLYYSQHLPLNLAMMINKMFIGYLKLFAGVCVLLPLTTEASGTCNRPDRANSVVTQKAENGSALCATSPPTETVSADFKIRCLAECLNRESCGDGFNFRPEAKLCELYSDPPTGYQVQPDCSYLKKVRLFTYLFICNRAS